MEKKICTSIKKQCHLNKIEGIFIDSINSIRWTVLIQELKQDIIDQSSSLNNWIMWNMVNISLEIKL